MRFLGRESEPAPHPCSHGWSSWDTFDQTTTELSGPLLSFTRDHSWGASPIRAKTCPSQFKGSFSAFFRGCLPPLSAARTLTLWIVSDGPDLLLANGSSLSGIALLSGPIWDRANRVTQVCHLKRIASKHDRRIGRMGDWTDHLCPCPSRLRWALP